MLVEVIQTVTVTQVTPKGPKEFKAFSLIWNPPGQQSLWWQLVGLVGADKSICHDVAYGSTLCFFLLSSSMF